MSWNYSNYHSCDKISETTEHFVSSWRMVKVLKKKNNLKMDSHTLIFRKEGVGLCTEYLAREQHHRKGPRTGNKRNLTVLSTIRKAGW